MGYGSHGSLGRGSCLSSLSYGCLGSCCSGGCLILVLSLLSIVGVVVLLISCWM